MISPFQRPPGHVCAQVEGAQSEVMVCSQQPDQSRSFEGTGFFFLPGHRGVCVQARGESGCSLTLVAADQDDWLVVAAL